MPRARRPCTEPGCPTLVEGGGYCARHARTREPFARRRSPKRDYGARHRQLAAAARERDGARCVRCGATAGLAGDHVDRLGPDELANYQTLCRRCHALKTGRSGAAARAVRAG